MWLFLILLSQLQHSSAELAAFGGGAPCRPTIVSSAQYRSFIMPKIFGGELNEADLPVENTFPACLNRPNRFSNRPTTSSHFHRISNYYYNQHQKPVSSVSPYHPRHHSMTYPAQATLQPSQQYTASYNAQYWNTTTSNPPVVGETQTSHYYHRYTHNQLNQQNGVNIPSYLEAIPLPRFQPASLGSVPSQVVQRRSNNVVSKDEPECCLFSPLASFLSMEQQEILHELIVEARNSGAAESKVSQLMDKYVREVLPPKKYLEFQQANEKFNREREERMHRGKRSTINLISGQKSVPERIRIHNSQRDLHDFLNQPITIRKLKELKKLD